MKEKEISELLKDADEEMMNRIAENFPDDDESRKQRIFEKTAEKYAQKLNEGRISGDGTKEIQAKVLRKETERMLPKYIAAVAAFAVVFTGAAAGIALNSRNNDSQIVYDAVQTVYTEISVFKSENVNTGSENTTNTGKPEPADAENKAVTAVSTVTVITGASESTSTEKNASSVTEASSETRKPESEAVTEAVTAAEESSKTEEDTQMPAETAPEVTEAAQEETEISDKLPDGQQEVWFWPLPDCLHVSSDFWDGRNHGGVDICTTEKQTNEGYTVYGKPVVAAFSGVVAAEYSTCTHHSGECHCGGGYGNYVVIAHEDGTFSAYYAHLKELTVERGQTVNAGDIIGYAGDSGYTTGACLHFEIRRGNTRTDPMSYVYKTDPVGYVYKDSDTDD